VLSSVTPAGKVWQALEQGRSPARSWSTSGPRTPRQPPQDGRICGGFRRWEWQPPTCLGYRDRPGGDMMDRPCPGGKPPPVRRRHPFPGCRRRPL